MRLPTGSIASTRRFRLKVQAGSRSTSTSSWMMNHCSSTPARERCFHWCVKRWRAVCRSRGFATLRFRMWKPTSAARSTNGLRAAPQSVPLCGTVAAMVSIDDLADRAPRALADGERLSLGEHSVRWFDTPHLPHAWECGFLTEERTPTLLCGDLFTQGGDDLPPLTESDILGPSEAFRHRMDYFSHTKNARALLERLASTKPTTLACMHGSAWRGDGAELLRALADALSG